MEYFRISQDKRCLHPPIITNIRDIIKRRPDAAAGKGEQVADANVAFIAPQPETDFPDILDAQVFLVSDRMKEVFRMYEPSLRFKMVCVLDNIRGDYANYHIPLFPEAAAVAGIVNREKRRMDFLKKVNEKADEELKEAVRRLKEDQDRMRDRLKVFWKPFLDGLQSEYGLLEAAGGAGPLSFSYLSFLRSGILDGGPWLRMDYYDSRGRASDVECGGCPDGFPAFPYLDKGFREIRELFAGQSQAGAYLADPILYDLADRYSEEIEPLVLESLFTLIEGFSLVLPRGFARLDEGEKEGGDSMLNWFDFKSYVITGTLYNLASVISFRDRSVLGMFSCPYELSPWWKPVYLKVLETFGSRSDRPAQCLR